MSIRNRLTRLIVLDRMAAQGMDDDPDDPEPHNAGPVSVMWDNAYHLTDQMLPAILAMTTQEALQEAVSELTELKATVLEYEHALRHAVDPHPVPGAPPHTACPDCQSLCQSALDGVNRGGFREIAQEIVDADPVHPSPD